MPSVQQLISLRGQIAALIREKGFCKAVLFKGFNSREEHNLNILIEDRYTSTTEEVSQVQRHFELEEKLVELLKCKVFITTTEQITSYHANKLKQPLRSVTLPLDSKDQKVDDEFRVQAEQYFGKTWQFNGSSSVGASQPKPNQYLAGVSFYSIPSSAQKASDGKVVVSSGGVARGNDAVDLAVSKLFLLL